MSRGRIVGRVVVGLALLLPLVVSAGRPAHRDATPPDGLHLAAAAPLPDPAEPPRTRPPGAYLRVLSAPDFLNADVADLRLYPTVAAWAPGLPNSWNESYQQSLDAIVGYWAGLLRPHDELLVPGDLVQGRWARDTQNTRIFGPTRSYGQKVQAIRRAGAVYYDAWARRFEEHGIGRVRPATGDHEYGDGPWDIFDYSTQLELRAYWEFKGQFVQVLKRLNGGVGYRSHPGRRSQARRTAYSWHPRPDVLVVTLDEFTRRRTRKGRLQMVREIDAGQLRWLQRELRRANRQRMRWIIVQGHLPILTPVRVSIGSSGMSYRGGRNSPLWQTMKKYGVDLYLAGEVHATSVLHADGIVQWNHGGLVGFKGGPDLTFGVTDVYRNRLQLATYRFPSRQRHGEYLWNTVGNGGNEEILYDVSRAVELGRLTLHRDGTLTGRTGLMKEYRRDWHLQRSDRR